MKRYIFILSLYFISVSVFGEDIDKISKEVGVIPNYENHKEIILIFSNNYLDSISFQSDCSNNKAIRVYEKRINILQLHHADNANIDISWVIDIVLNFELLTKIESESDGNYLGKYQPTNRDIKRWLEWFENHENNICWCAEKNILYLKKE